MPQPALELEAYSTEILMAAVAILVLLSAYFSGSETALMSINRYRLQHLTNNNHKAARKVARLLKRPDRLLGVILIGNNLVNILGASLATLIGLRLFGDWGPLVSTVSVTMVFLIFAEVTPKTIAAQFPERIAFFSVYLLEPLLKVLYPIVVMVNAISNKLAGIFGAHPKSGQFIDRLTNEELRTLVHEGATIAGKGEDMMLGVLDLEKITVDDIIVPKSEIVSIDIEQDIASIVHQICTSQHTRLPIVKGGLDNVLGVLHARKAGRFLAEKEKTKAALMQVVQDACFVPEGTPLSIQLINFQKTKNRIGLVVDEYGSVRGIVTLEDILEEIVGEFTTDITGSLPEIHPQPDGTYLIDGTAALRQINRVLRWKLPLSGPKTLNGLIVEHLEVIPENNLCLNVAGYRIETIQISDNMVRMAKVSQTEQSEQPDEAQSE